VTSIKIDKSFTAGLPSEQKDAAIVETTIQLAHRLNLLGKPQSLPDLLERLESQNNKRHVS
jgi:hypothetical protein